MYKVKAFWLKGSVEEMSVPGLWVEYTAISLLSISDGIYI